MDVVNVTITTDAKHTTVRCSWCLQEVPAYWDRIITEHSDDAVLVIEPHQAPAGTSCSGSHRKI